MKSIVIYNSQTGFTKQYAQWISDVAGCECDKSLYLRDDVVVLPIEYI